MLAGACIAGVLAAAGIPAAQAHQTRLVVGAPAITSTVALAPAPVVTTRARLVTSPTVVVAERPLVTGPIPIPAPTVFEVMQEPTIIATRVVTPRVAAVAGAPAMTRTSFALAAAPVEGTPEWYSYCAAKYRSFDPATGTYLAFSGVRRMCR